MAKHRLVRGRLGYEQESTLGQESDLPRHRRGADTADLLLGGQYEGERYRVWWG